MNNTPMSAYALKAEYEIRKFDENQMRRELAVWRAAYDKATRERKKAFSAWQDKLKEAAK